MLSSPGIAQASQGLWLQICWLDIFIDRDAQSHIPPHGRREAHRREHTQCTLPERGSIYRRHSAASLLILVGIA